jgi:hypothetical protein
MANGEGRMPNGDDARLADRRRVCDRCTMSMDPGSIFLSLLVGSVGFVLFVYGKKQDRYPQLIAGLALMVYPYFVGNPWLMLLVGVVILCGLWVAVREGW